MVSEMKDQPPRTTKTVILTAFSICNEINSSRTIYQVLNIHKNVTDFSQMNLAYNPATSSDIPTMLPCASDIENPGQLPVQEVLEGTDYCIW